MLQQHTNALLRRIYSYCWLAQPQSGCCFDRTALVRDKKDNGLNVEIHNILQVKETALQS
jgi:hypothetical protein